MRIDQFCVHTHTTFCDGKNTAEEMVQAAVRLGFSALGFSGHGYAPHDPYCMAKETEAAYRQEILRLRQVYDGQLEILLGQEHDSLADYTDYPYDYLIESVHYVKAGDTFCPVDWSIADTEKAVREQFGGDIYGFCRAYFEACAEAYTRSPAQIAGHLDLVSKFNENSTLFDAADPRYAQPAMEAASCAVERGLVLEVNTGAIAKGYRTTPYPSQALLRHIRQLGGQMMINSDCHDLRYLTCHYRQAAELLRSCGFDHVVALTGAGWREIGLP